MEDANMPDLLGNNNKTNSMPDLNPKPMARKPHRKTRTGCRTCKQRKIKCDEQRPSCNNCLKHSVQCDFIFSGGGSAINGAAPPHANSSPKPNVVSNNSPNFASNSDLSSNLDLISLQLLHNYTTSTAGTLHTDPAMKSLWKINVPEVGFEYAFVMHGILAISAQHLAHYSSNPQRRANYIHLASTHHQNGLRIACSLLSNITPQNCHAVYTFSALTLLYTLASPWKPGDFLLVGEKGFADWLFLVKGTSAIINSSQEILLNGPLGPMFIAGQKRSQIWEQYLREITPSTDPLYELEDLIQRNVRDKNALTFLLPALQSLRKSFAYMYTPTPLPGSESSDIFVWVFEVSDSYLQALRNHNQEALCIFAYFCVVLARLDKHWWVQGWTVHLMEKIWKELDGEHRLWIRWPVDEIGWIPPPAYN